MILWKLLVLLNILKNFLILIFIKSSFDSWIFESWIFILIILESWFLKSNFLLILEVFLTQSWTHSWMSSSLLSWSDLEFWAFCHHLCYHQNSLNQSWLIMMLASTRNLTSFSLSPTNWKYINFFICPTVCDLVSEWAKWPEQRRARSLTILLFSI